jgi:hypothetical protein
MKNKLVLIIVACFGIIMAGCGPGDRSHESALRLMPVVSDSTASVPALADTINLSSAMPKDKKFIKTADLKFKVHSVLRATEKIEDLAVRYNGYITSSDLMNREENSRSSRISRDSILKSREIVVVNEIQLRIPNVQLDSFVRELNPLVVFLDYRVIKLNDVTLQVTGNQKKSDRLAKFEQQQQKHIDTKAGKVNETSDAQDKLLDRQNQADDIQLNSMSLEDQVKYCNLSVEIYQKPLIVKEVVADFDAASRAKPNFFARIWNSLVQGWWVLGEVFLFLVKLWGLALLIAGAFFGVKLILKLFRKK